MAIKSHSICYSSVFRFFSLPKTILKPCNCLLYCRKLQATVLSSQNLRCSFYVTLSLCLCRYTHRQSNIFGRCNTLKHMATGETVVYSHTNTVICNNKNIIYYLSPRQKHINQIKYLLTCYMAVFVFPSYVPFEMGCHYWLEHGFIIDCGRSSNER